VPFTDVKDTVVVGVVVVNFFLVVLFSLELVGIWVVGFLLNVTSVLFFCIDGTRPTMIGVRFLNLESCKVITGVLGCSSFVTLCFLAGIEETLLFWIGLSDLTLSVVVDIVAEYFFSGTAVEVGRGVFFLLVANVLCSPLLSNIHVDIPSDEGLVLTF
jgi:hypothetical protein